jgi:hypothetical protein
VTLCVYALATPVAGVLRLRGIEREPLRIVTVGRVSAVVGELRRRPAATHDVLKRYDAVVRRLFERYTALLPARFATAVGRDELALILRTRQQTLRRALGHVRGRVQMNVRIVSGATDVALASPKPAGDGGGIAYLRRRAAEAGIPAFEPLRAAVKTWVRDEHVEKRGRVATVYHLIPRSAAEAYRRAMIARADQVHLHAIVSGPFPAYAFTEL